MANSNRTQKQKDEEQLKRDSARSTAQYRASGGRTGVGHRRRLGAKRTTQGRTTSEMAQKRKDEKQLKIDSQRSTAQYRASGGRTGVGRRTSTPPTRPSTPTKTNPTSKPKGTPMEQWARANPKLAAKVKPGQSGYAAAQKVLREMRAKRSNINKGKTA